MKKMARACLVLVLSAAAAAVSAEGMKDLPGMKDTKGTHATAAPAVHATSATATRLDREAGKVTLARGPVPALNWPATTMGFKVRDRALHDRLAPGSKVDVEFVQEGRDHVVTSVRQPGALQGAWQR